MTKYAQPCGDGWTGGAKIIPLSQADALEWAEANLSPAEIERRFGELVEDA
jgi:hypothetical protein